MMLILCEQDNNKGKKCSSVYFAASVTFAKLSLEFRCIGFNECHEPRCSLGLSRENIPECLSAALLMHNSLMYATNIKYVLALD